VRAGDGAERDSNGHKNPWNDFGHDNLAGYRNFSPARWVCSGVTAEILAKVFWPAMSL
jgi:hypothetical protein